MVNLASKAGTYRADEAWREMQRSVTLLNVEGTVKNGCLAGLYVALDYPAIDPVTGRCRSRQEQDNALGDYADLDTVNATPEEWLVTIIGGWTEKVQRKTSAKPDGVSDLGTLGEIRVLSLDVKYESKKSQDYTFKSLCQATFVRKNNVTP